MLKIDKLHSAACQLDTAINLHLSDGCAVSACVLTHSAWSLLKDLAKHHGIESSRQWAANGFPDKQPQEVWKELDSYWNFFKHADQDPDAVLDFDPTYLDEVIMLALFDISQLGLIKSTSMDTFELWFVARSSLFENNTDIKNSAISLFPNIENMNLKEQKAFGLRVTEEQIRDPHD